MTGNSLKKGLIWLLLLLLLPLSSLAAEEEPPSFATDSGNIAIEHIEDGNIASYITLPQGEGLRVLSLEGAQGLYFKWHTLPSAYTLRWLGTSGTVLSEETVIPLYFNEYRPAPKEAVSCLLLTAEKTELSELTLIPKGPLPDYIQQWEAPLEHPSYMLLCGYPGDELLFFGGLVPTAVNEGIPLSIAYMSNYSRKRLDEGLSALWQLGIRNYPVLLDIPTGRNREVGYLNANWKDQSDKVYKLLQRYNPQVLISFDDQGERLTPFEYEKHTRYMGEAQTAVTGQNLLKALDKKNPFTGTVLTKSIEGTVTEDYARPLGYYNNQTALEVAQKIYDSCYNSLRTFHYTVEQGNSYGFILGEGIESALFSLCSFTNLYAPIPAITPEPTLAPTQEPTAEPNQIPTFTPCMTQAPVYTQAPTELPSKEPVTVNLLYLHIALPLAVGLLIVLLLVASKKENRKKLLPLIIILPLLVLLVGVCLSFNLLTRREPVSEATQKPDFEVTTDPTQTPAPTEVPTPTPSPTPTLEPTPTPESEKWAELFLEKGQEEEITVDIENGHWQYKGEGLYIDIRRHTDGKPTVWYTAHLYMKEDAFRPMFGNEGRTGRTSYTPWKIARQNRAILMVTGDNMLNMDADLKGVMLRDGQVYSQQRKNAIMAWDPYAYSIATYDKGVTLQELQEKGYENTLTFGPVLLKNGVIDENSINKSHVGKPNPRVALGMVEPGHLVIIVVDGRRDEYSKGVSLLTLAEMLQAEGCTEAYNMDGGVSACMIFMGEQLNSHGNVTDWSKQRPMPDGLAFGYSELVPWVTDPIYNDGIDVSYDKRP